MNCLEFKSKGIFVERFFCKKFFVILCGACVATGAWASPEHYLEPKQTSIDIVNAWHAAGGQYYIDPLSTYSLYDNLSAQMTKVSSTNHGTHDDEGAVVLIIAHNIYANGGEFCMTQVQAANQNGRRYTWIDYYEYPGKYKCETLCRPGYWGTGCAQTGTPPDCDTDKLDFGTYTKKTDGEWENRITGNVYAFSRDNAEATSVTTAEHWVLAVVKKMDHGVIVSPISVEAERYQSGTGDGKFSWITSVKSNKQEVLLCAQGYEPNATKTDCQEPAWCPQKKALSNLCPGYSAEGYNSENHKLVSNGSCYIIRCDYDTYGFTSTLDKTCKECDGGPLAYIDANGLCAKCDKGDMPNDTRTGCIGKGRIEHFNQTQMRTGPNTDRECWLETDGRKFAGCIYNCPASTACWENKRCQVCDSDK